MVIDVNDVHGRRWTIDEIIRVVDANGTFIAIGDKSYRYESNDHLIVNEDGEAVITVPAVSLNGSGR